MFGIYIKRKDINARKRIQIANEFDMTLKNIMMLAMRMF